MTTTKAPLSPVTSSIPLRIWATLGDAKMLPHTAASRRPSPTKPAWAGSWPDPPPERSATREEDDVLGL